MSINITSCSIQPTGNNSTPLNSIMIVNYNSINLTNYVLNAVFVQYDIGDSPQFSTGNGNINPFDNFESFITSLTGTMSGISLILDSLNVFENQIYIPLNSQTTRNGCVLFSCQGFLWYVSIFIDVLTGETYHTTTYSNTCVNLIKSHILGSDVTPDYIAFENNLLGWTGNNKLLSQGYNFYAFDPINNVYLCASDVENNPFTLITSYTGSISFNDSHNPEAGGYSYISATLMLECSEIITGAVAGNFMSVEDFNNIFMTNVNISNAIGITAGTVINNINTLDILSSITYDTSINVNMTDNVPFNVLGNVCSCSVNVNNMLMTIDIQTYLKNTVQDGYLILNSNNNESNPNISIIYVNFSDTPILSYIGDVVDNGSSVTCQLTTIGFTETTQSLSIVKLSSHIKTDMLDHDVYHEYQILGNLNGNYVAVGYGYPLTTQITATNIAISEQSEYYKVTYKLSVADVLSGYSIGSTGYFLSNNGNYTSTLYSQSGMSYGILNQYIQLIDGQIINPDILILPVEFNQNNSLISCTPHTSDTTLVGYKTLSNATNQQIINGVFLLQLIDGSYYNLQLADVYNINVVYNTSSKMYLAPFHGYYYTLKTYPLTSIVKNTFTSSSLSTTAIDNIITVGNLSISNTTVIGTGSCPTLNNTDSDTQLYQFQYNYVLGTNSITMSTMLFGISRINTQTYIFNDSVSGFDINVLNTLVNGSFYVPSLYSSDQNFINVTVDQTTPPVSGSDMVITYVVENGGQNTDIMSMYYINTQLITFSDVFSFVNSSNCIKVQLSMGQGQNHSTVNAMSINMINSFNITLTPIIFKNIFGANPPLFIVLYADGSYNYSSLPPIYNICVNQSNPINLIAPSIVYTSGTTGLDNSIPMVQFQMNSPILVGNYSLTGITGTASYQPLTQNYEQFVAINNVTNPYVNTGTLSSDLNFAINVPQPFENFCLINGGNNANLIYYDYGYNYQLMYNYLLNGNTGTMTVLSNNIYLSIYDNTISNASSNILQKYRISQCDVYYVGVSQNNVNNYYQIIPITGASNNRINGLNKFKCNMIQSQIVFDILLFYVQYDTLTNTSRISYFPPTNTVIPYNIYNYVYQTTNVFSLYEEIMTLINNIYSMVVNFTNKIYTYAINAYNNDNSITTGSYWQLANQGLMTLGNAGIINSGYINGVQDSYYLSGGTGAFDYLSLNVSKFQLLIQNISSPYQLYTDYEVNTLVADAGSRYLIQIYQYLTSEVINQTNTINTTLSNDAYTSSINIVSNDISTQQSIYSTLTNISLMEQELQLLQSLIVQLSDEILSS